MGFVSAYLEFPMTANTTLIDHANEDVTRLT